MQTLYGILASGALGLICTEFIHGKREISFVLTDNRSKDIVEFCQKNDIPVYSGNPRKGRGFEFMSRYNADILLSVNYLYIVEKDIIEFPRRYAINFHGSLLPKYRGRSPHVWAIINNESETGITAHRMTEGCDEGDILYQEKIPITHNATGAEILQFFTLKYPEVIDKVLSILDSQNILFTPQDETKATWFGKRSPEDGGINWNWHKERIYNWVRAQVKPYPGAFTFYRNEKVVIHCVEFCDNGFSYNDPNGKILLGGKEPVIKTPNGALKLTSIETATSFIFQKDEVLHEGY